MYDRTSLRGHPSSPPRILLLGSYRDACGLRSPELHDALGEAVETFHLPVPSPYAGGVRAFRDASHMVERNGIEVVHLMDARLAVTGVALRRRLGVPVSASIDTASVRRGPAARLLALALNQLDQGFVSSAATARFLRRRTPRLAIATAPSVAMALPEPSRQALAAMSRRLSSLTPGRVIIGLPWTCETDHLRWYRDAVAPLLSGNPVCLLLGAPGHRQARLLVGAIGLREHYRVHTGALDADTLAAAARCVDVFLLPGDPRHAWCTDDLTLALTASRVPLIVGGAVRSSFVHHEENAFAAAAGNPFSLVSTLNDLLRLPAIQRHYLGEQFADYTRDTWPAGAAAQIYVERFSALVGRPQIPAELRAA